MRHRLKSADAKWSALLQERLTEMLPQVTDGDCQDLGQVTDEARRQFQWLEHVLSKLPERERQARQFIFMREVHHLLKVFVFESAKQVAKPLEDQFNRSLNPNDLRAMLDRQLALMTGRG